MATIGHAEQQEHAAGPKVITVKVNNQPVVFEDHKATGAEIKATAIAQGVAIQADFALFEVKHGEPLKPIGDADTVTLHPQQAFRALAPDDNS
jgi:hypothetical protein